MKMNEVKSITWTKMAEIKTKAKTPMGIYKVICKEFDEPLFKNAYDVADSIADGYIQVCDDGIIIWCS